MHQENPPCPGLPVMAAVIPAPAVPVVVVCPALFPGYCSQNPLKILVAAATSCVALHHTLANELAKNTPCAKWAQLQFQERQPIRACTLSHEEQSRMSRIHLRSEEKPGHCEMSVKYWPRTEGI